MSKAIGLSLKRVDANPGVPAFVNVLYGRTIWLNRRFWDMVEPEDEEVNDIAKILSHESVHIALWDVELWASKKLDNRELFGTVETQDISGLKA
jgi:hypothetical protein